MSEIEEIVQEFLVESTEGLDQLDRSLVALEQAPGDGELLSSIFRCIHTIKGTSGFLGFGQLERVAHVGESLLSDLRDGKKTLTPEITSALLTLVDAVRLMLGHVQSSGTDGSDDWTALIATFNRLQQGESAAEAPPSAPPPASEVASASIDPPAAPVPAPMGEASAAPVPAETVESGSPEIRDRRADGVVDNTIRVDVGLLDKLMNLVGELVLARNQVLQHTATTEDSAFLATSQRLNLITTELQEGVMKTRMQPIGNVWSKFPRVVRDLSQALQKQVRIEMEGKETELDKTIIEAIKDPLTHIVRNSVDHGLESPDERVKAGKPAEGRLLLRAYHEGGQVNIEISDDGRGIDPERLRAKAAEKGLMPAEQLTRMSDREVLNLIFAAGFSTAEKVTNVSGRGVGMDVVRTNIEKIGGTVDVQSVVGRGTTLKIKIPLTLAIIPALVVSTAGDRYAIPQVSLLELLRVEGDEASQSIEMIHGAPVYRLRGNLLPLVHLNQVLGFQLGFWASEEAKHEVVKIVVLQADEQSFGLAVDEINDTEEIVVKPLGKLLKGLTTFAGTTIMGDGRVALILDVLGLGQGADLVSKNRERGRADADEEALGRGSNASAQRQNLLIFELAGHRRMAIPLSMISRLEEFPVDTVERTGRHEVVQYREEIMPLIRLDKIVDGCGQAAAKDQMQVVVYTHGGQYVGLVVENILDILEESITVQRRTAGGVVSGSAVIQGKVTDLLDVAAVIARSEIGLPDAADAAELVGTGV